MARPTIPEREPIYDVFLGTLIKWQATHALTVEDPHHTETVATGQLIVRYGIRYLGKPHLSIVPGLVALDYGDMLVGEAAFEFLLNKSNLYPRADVLGYRNDGRDEMIVVKQLDLVLPLEVLVYSDVTAAMPLASVTALIAPASTPTTDRLKRNLPQYETLEDWQSYE